ncbi:MAG: polysaccharide deacetylase family protein [Elusimicrobia bacterium]|nr:polysaccharide deacetylase family protein [Elusimicrobiota bacterium]
MRKKNVRCPVSNVFFKNKLFVFILFAMLLTLDFGPWTSDCHSSEKIISLTFHDGPNPKSTPQLLKILDDANVKATFFVVGKMAEKYPGLVKEIYKRGHQIANHTYDHKNLNTLSTIEVISELSRTRLLIKEITGVNTYLFTPPGGHYNAKVISDANSCGYKMALWSVFPEDHRNPSPVIYEKVVSDSQDGSVVLLHNGPPDTIDALPKIIEKLKARGFTFTTLSELLSKNKGKHIVYPRD